MNTTKKLALKDRTIAAAKANEVKGGPIYMQAGNVCLLPAVQTPGTGNGLLLPAVQKVH